jgi:glycerophosphoryl diester phosphodiesterase
VTRPFFSASGPLVFAHRGGAGLAPENTVAAFDNAEALGVDGLELDVRLSRDGVVVVHHDSTLERTTNRAGPVGAFTAAELARADAGFHFGSGLDRPFRGRGLGVPTLESVLDRFPERPIIIELKENRVELARAVIETVRSARAVDRVCLGSFGYLVLRTVRSMAPEIATSAAKWEVRWALYRSRCGWPVSRVPYRGFQVPEIAGSTRVVSPRFVRHARAAGLSVQVWTVDRESDARRLLEWQVDGLITDRPDVLVPLVRRYVAAVDSA